MKTKEDVLKQLNFNATQEQIAGGFIFSQPAYTFTLEAMELYAQEVTKELQQGNDNLKKAVDGLDRNITRLSEENAKLRELLERVNLKR